MKREPGPAWDAGSSMHEQEQWPEHAAFMEALVDDGFVVLGGPLGGGSVVRRAGSCYAPDQYVRVSASSTILGRSLSSKRSSTPEASSRSRPV
ncbi:MAG: hypothetical protein QOE95_1586 [Gaiellaceae bacterium]|nr:hypothetical protein [Gaiellaceae bacterium]